MIKFLEFHILLYLFSRNYPIFKDSRILHLQTLHFYSWAHLTFKGVSEKISKINDRKIEEYKEKKIKKKKIENTKHKIVPKFLEEKKTTAEKSNPENEWILRDKTDTVVEMKSTETEKEKRGIEKK